MEFKTKYLSPDIKLSLYDDALFKTETAFDHHMLVWFISGETKIVLAEGNYVFGPGDIFLIPRNQLATIINYPKDGRPHKTVAMHLTTPRLRKFYEKHQPVCQQLSHLEDIRKFGNHPLLESCLSSLMPYFDLKEALPGNIESIKIEEAISILRIIDPGIDGLLSNFEEPGKINIVDFMEKNFMFNMTLEKFGYLTGRSLATFRRDFSKSFNTTPQKWLTQKRLALAHYYLVQKQQKPIDVYLEVGFEDLSHFSFAFKKQFGYPPTGISHVSGDLTNSIPGINNF